MKTKTDYLRNVVMQLRLTGIGADLDSLLVNAQSNQISYLDFAVAIMDTEINYRNRKNLQKRSKFAKLPMNNNLDLWQYDRQKGISKQQLSQLRECHWIEQNFNLVLMGPSGAGKTFITAGLCNDALKIGYKACFRTMEQINYILKMKDLTKTAAREYQTILKTDLLAIDDIMMFPMEKKQAVSLFNLIDYLHQKASMIITTNKSPDEWVNVLEDEVLATAILDRLLYKCEVVKLSGPSFRMDNRKTIFC